MTRQRTSEELEQFGKHILTWSQQNPRPMPWKNFSDPYSIWIAEIILQQTRVDQGREYFQNFIHTFPDLQALAEATLEEVLLVWEGLGYYSRARNLHHTARYVWNDLEGRWPDNAAELMKLKGIGPYTSAAIASFAYGERIGVVDGNVKRVISRYFGIADDIGSPATQRAIQGLVNRIVEHIPSEDFNQGIMNFGAMTCVPRNPDCVKCPARRTCEAYQLNIVDQLPVKIRSQTKQRRWLNFGVFVHDGRIAISQNLDSNVWKNLHLFPMVGRHSNFRTGMESTERDRSPQYSLMEKMEWVLSHRKLVLHFYQVKDWPSEWDSNVNIELVELEKLNNFALPRPLRLFLKQNSCKLGINHSHDQ